MIKQIFDLLVSLFGLIIFSPLFLILGISIKILMPGPIFFFQTRIGLGGKEFRIVKFRTMEVNRKSFEGSFDAGSRSRITPLGKILRRYKIDEIPQLFNVLIGDMSLVGPRPEVREWTEVYPEKWAIILSVKPGITGLGSIEFRNEEELLSQSPDPMETYRNIILPRKLDIYINYVNNHTLFGDMLIILKTIYAVLFR
jgi:lipopolysaccharide/colanic/teichoic acid biosynthesis glycosyltransferase